VLAIAHKSPFSCGKTFYANNWSPGHNPSGSIDWQSYGGDAINGETVRATAGGTATFDNERAAPATASGCRSCTATAPAPATPTSPRWSVPPDRPCR
jgi:hypothetical protein